MRFLIAIFLMFGINSLSAQTELINHKSHSGTNRNFKVTRSSGNFGLMVINEELEKDDQSSYKLIFTQEGSRVNYILFKTKNKTLNTAMCMAEDEVIENVSLSNPSAAIREGVVQILVDELREYRKLEKK